MEVTIQMARKMALNQQGLLSSKPQFGRGKSAVLRAIEHLGYVQIDAISVIQRAHHHTLWSRVPGYKPKHLLDLLAKDRKIFEYWSHAVSFLPVKHYQFALPVMQHIRSRGKHWYEIEPEIKQTVLSSIRNEGPKYARDFETPPLDSSIMWNWKPAKKALHELFMDGSITVISRAGFQRKYDLPEKFSPQLLNSSIPSREDYLWHEIKTTCRAHGLVTLAEIKYQKFFTKSELSDLVATKVGSGELAEVQVKGLKSLFYTLPDLMEQQPQRVVKQVHLLSPFDNAVIQRKRIKALFNFDYQTEIYYPAHKRQYGYFSMPILYGTEFIGRMDPKAHRDRGCLEIRNLVLEPHVKISDQLITKLLQKLHDFTLFNGCSYFTITKASPKALIDILHP